MAKDKYEANSFWGGVTRHYGRRTTSLARGSMVHTTGRQRELVYEFDYNDLPVWNNHVTNGNIRIPDGSIIKEFKFEVTDPFKGDEDAQMQFGLMDSNGDILSHTFFGALQGFIGKQRGFQAWFPNTSVSYAGFQKACDGENYTLLHICVLGKLTCGEARVTIVYEPPFYSYHYDGKSSEFNRSGTLMPNRTNCCDEPCKVYTVDPCSTAERVNVTPIPECPEPAIKLSDYVKEVITPAADVVCEGHVNDTNTVTVAPSCGCP